MFVFYISYEARIEMWRMYSQRRISFLKTTWYNSVQALVGAEGVLEKACSD